jgi:hypothetical protein
MAPPHAGHFMTTGLTGAFASSSAKSFLQEGQAICMVTP